MRADPTRLLSVLLWPALLLAAPPLLAQSPEFPVEDLLRPPALGFEFGPSDDGPLPNRLDRPANLLGAYGNWHRIDSEPHLLAPALLFGDEGLADGPLDEAALIRAVAELGDVDRDSVQIVRRGSQRRLRGEAAEAIQLALETLRRGLPPRIAMEIVLERVEQDASEVLLKGSRRIRFGELVTLAEIEQRPVIADFDAEIAQSSAVASPKISTTFAGASVTLRARALPAGEDAVVEALVRVAVQLPDEKIEAHPEIGPLDRIANEFTECGLCFRLQAGTSSVHEWTDDDGSRLRLTCTPEWDPVDFAGSPTFASPLLREPVLGFRYRRDALVEKPHASTDLRAIVASLAKAYAEALGPLEKGQAMMVFDAEQGQVFDTKIATAMDRALCAARVSIEILDQGPDGAAPRPVATIAGPMILGHSSCFAGAREHSFLEDWNIEVAQAAHVPDPIPGIIENGYFLTATVQGDASGRPELLELEFDLSRLREIRRQQITLNVATISTVNDDPLVKIPQTAVIVEQPVEHSLRVRSRLPLDADGQATLRRSARLLFGTGHELLIRVKVDA